MGTGRPLDGDRSAKDVINYPDLHATDIEAAAPVRHTPEPGAAGGIIESDGVKWVRVDALSEGSVTPTEIANRTRKFFVPALGGYNNTIAQVLIHRYAGGLLFTDDDDCKGYGQFIVPTNFVSGMSVTAAIWMDVLSNGNVYVTNEAQYGQCAEALAAHSDSLGPTAIAVTNTVRNCIQELTLTNAAIGDLVALAFRREADDALDTADEDGYFSGWIVEYTADS